MHIKHKGYLGLWYFHSFNQLRQIYDLTAKLISLNLCLIANLALCKTVKKVSQNPYDFICQR